MPKIEYSPISAFGKKMEEMKTDKAAVAMAAAREVLSINTTTTVFVNDGTSTLYVFRALRDALLTAKRRIRLLSNNTAVFTELIVDTAVAEFCENAVSLPGSYDRDFVGFFPSEEIPSEENYLRNKLSKCEVGILAVSTLTSDGGPGGVHANQRFIKQCVLEQGKTLSKLLVVADWKKLAVDPAGTSHALQPSETTKWTDWTTGCYKKKLTIVTTRPPDLIDDVSARSVTASERNKEIANAKGDRAKEMRAWYKWHSKQLWVDLGHQFVELPGT